MQSKILIDLNEDGKPVITIRKPDPKSKPGDFPDVRDKMVQMFIQGNQYATIHHIDEHAVISSMNVLDMLTMILDCNYYFFKPDAPDSKAKEFEQAIFKVQELLEEATGERSSAFNKRAKE